MSWKTDTICAVLIIVGGALAVFGSGYILHTRKVHPAFMIGGVLLSIGLAILVFIPSQVTGDDE